MAQLVAWKDDADRKPLLLRGARQTGKTWIMEKFASETFDDYVKIDFMFDETMQGLFERDLDPKRVVREISLRTGHTVVPGKTLLIFDEIQEAPRALSALKYFCEQAREYHVIAAGSYMGISLRRENESFPVGKVNQLTLRPMGFAEYLRATAGDPIADAVERADMDLLAGFEDMLKESLKEYLVVGGMPEVVRSFSGQRDLNKVRAIQLAMLQDYDADFSKHAPARILERMRLVWRSLPGQLAKENKKFVYGAVREGARARDFEECLQWLADYGAVTKVPRVSALHRPFAGYEDLSSFKLFALDVGLLGALAHLEPSCVLDDDRLFVEFKGAITEQYVLQELLLQNMSPVYWSSKSGNAETDFAVELGSAAVPIEVKAGENLQAKSLKVARDKFSLERCVRTSLSPYRDEGWLVNVPLWAIGQLNKLA